MTDFWGFLEPFKAFLRALKWPSSSFAGFPRPGGRVPEASEEGAKLGPDSASLRRTTDGVPAFWEAESSPLDPPFAQLFGFWSLKGLPDWLSEAFFFI